MFPYYLAAYIKILQLNVRLTDSTNIKSSTFIVIKITINVIFIIISSVEYCQLATYNVLQCLQDKMYFMSLVKPTHTHNHNYARATSFISDACPEKESLIHLKPFLVVQIWFILATMYNQLNSKKKLVSVKVSDKIL